MFLLLLLASLVVGCNSNMKIVAFQPMDNYFINDHFPINYYFGAVVWLMLLLLLLLLLLLVKNQSPWHHNNIPIFIQLLENLLIGILMSDSIELSCYGTVFFFFYTFTSDNTTTVAVTIAATAFIWWHNNNNNNNELYENMNLMICMQLLQIINSIIV